MLEVQKLLIVCYTITIVINVSFLLLIHHSALILDALLQPCYFYVGSVDDGLYHKIFKSCLSDKTFK